MRGTGIQFVVSLLPGHVTVGRKGCSLEDMQSIYMTVDTRAGMSVIPQELADRLGIVPEESDDVSRVCGSGATWGQSKMRMIYVKENGEKVEATLSVMIQPP